MGPNDKASRGDLECSQLLDKLGMWLHGPLGILICRQCEVGVPSEHAMGHCKQKHNLTVPASLRAGFEELCASRQVLKKAEDFAIPRAGGPPIQGIAAPVPGYSCTASLACEYSVQDLQTMLRHSKDKHNEAVTGKCSFRPSKVQCVFKGIGKVYFEVDAAASKQCNLDVRRYLRTVFLQTHANDPVVVHESDRDRTPLLKLTKWDEFEPEIRQDHGQRQAAGLLKGKHSAQESGGVFISLEKVVRSYHTAVRALLSSSLHRFTVAKVLWNGPGYTQNQTDSFAMVANDNERYDSLYVQMMRAMIRKELGHECRLKFAYNAPQRETLDLLLHLLELDAKHNTESSLHEALDAYHRFCWSLIDYRDVNGPSAWRNPLQRFLWLKAMRSDGSFISAKDLTPILAALKYFCRLVTLYEGLSDHDEEDLQQGDVQRVGELYDAILRLGQPTIFNHIFELQQRASALAYSQTAESHVHVAEDYKSITIGTETLVLENLRKGMRSLVETVKERFVAVSTVPAWPDVGEKSVVEDMSNVDRGYSFLEEEPFRSDKYALFLELVERRRLGTLLSGGHWTWDHAAIRKFLDDADRLWEQVIHLLYIGVHLSTRVTQFLQHQLRNADRPRNLIFQGGECFLLTRYSKTTHMKGADSCTPAVLCEPLRELLLVLLGSGFREAQALLAGVVHGEEARWDYRTYLCVADGKRLTPERFCLELPRRNREVFECAWGARDLRQGMITLGHTFIGPNEQFACADDVLAEAADHTVEVDIAHYAVVHGALPRTSTNQMNKHRWLAKQWGSVVGLGPFPPPEPVILSHSHPSKSTLLVDKKQLAEDVSQLLIRGLADAVGSAVTKSLADAGWTAESPALLRRIANALEQQPSQRSPHMPAPLAPPSPFTPHAPTLLPTENLNVPMNDADDGQPEASSSLDDNPFDSSTWKVRRQPRQRSLHIPALPPSPFTPHASTFLPTKTVPMNDANDEQPEASSSPLDNPFDSSTWKVRRYAARPSKQWTSTTSGTSSPTESLMQKKHLCKLKPAEYVTNPTRVHRATGEDPSDGLYDSDLEDLRSQLQLPGRCKRALPASSSYSNERELTPPPKRQRLSHRDMRVGEEAGDEEEEHGGSFLDDGHSRGSLGDLIMPDSVDPGEEEQSALSLKNFPRCGLTEQEALKENIRDAMRHILNDPAAREKSQGQLEGILAVMRGNQDAMVTLRTGGGKSMFWLVPPILDPRIRLLVVCPYSALLDEQCEKAQKLGLKAQNFKHSKACDSDVQIMFVQVEHVCANSQLSLFLSRRDAPKFTCLIVDEHHDETICHPGRKSAWAALAAWVSQSKMALVLVSGTSPPTLQSHFLHRFHLDAQQTLLIRATTNRPEIRLHALEVNPSQEKAALERLVRALMGKLSTDDRMLVYFSSCEEAESFAKRLGIAVYHSKLTGGEEEKKRNLRLWDEGSTRAMVCTSAFGTGVDRMNVRFVVIFNSKYSLMSTMQMAGRAGRDGKESHAFFVTSMKPPRPSPTTSSKVDPSMTYELGQLVYGKSCRVRQAMAYMDGEQLARNCRELPGQFACDACEPDGEMQVFVKKAVQPIQASVQPRSKAMNATRSLQESALGFMASSSKHTGQVPPAAVTVPPARTFKFTSATAVAPSAVEPTATQPSSGLRGDKTATSLAMLGAAELFEQQRPICRDMWQPRSQPTPVSRRPEASTSMKHRLAPSSSMGELPRYASRILASSEAQKSRLNRTRALDRYMPRLQHICAIHFVVTGDVVDDHFPHCDLQETLTPGDFMAFRKSFVFEKFTYCYYCGMPQDRSRNDECPKCHLHSYGDNVQCKFGNVIFRVAFGIWQHEALRREMAVELGMQEPIDTEEQFTAWANLDDRNDGKYHNCLEAFLWLCHRRELEEAAHVT